VCRKSEPAKSSYIEIQGKESVVRKGNAEDNRTLFLFHQAFVLRHVCKLKICLKCCRQFVLFIQLLIHSIFEDAAISSDYVYVVN
jgi:hypothetical protein